MPSSWPGWHAHFVLDNNAGRRGVKPGMLSSIVFACLVLAFVACSSIPIAASPKTLSASGAAYRHRPIIYLTTATLSGGNSGVPPHRTVWHVAWCRPRMGVHFGSALVAPGVREPGYAAHWVYETVHARQIRAAMNGAVFNESLFPAVPIGGVGLGYGQWVAGSDATSAKYCVGFTGDGRPPRYGLPWIRTAPMVYTHSRTGTGINAGRMVPFFTVSPSIRRDYPYGFGCVGLIVYAGHFNANPVAGGWENAQALNPDDLRARTLLAWTTAGDVFFIAADMSGQRHGPGPLPQSDGATWGDGVRFLQQVLPDDLKTRFRRCLRHGRRIEIVGAVMLDGGVSTEFGYRRIDRRGWINLDRSAPHGGEGVPNAYIPSIVYAIAPDRARLVRRKRRT